VGPPIPLYGSASLADLVPSLLAALGADGFANPMEIEPTARVCMLVIDGLGHELIRDNAASAPFLAGLAEDAAPITAGFPSSTSVSFASLGTGRTPGEHGIMGYTMAIAGHHRAMNTLSWALHGLGPHHDLLEEVIPEQFQPTPTAYEVAAAQGIEVSAVGPGQLAHTGLTRAALRGARYRFALSLGDLAAESIRALERGRRSFVQSYHPDLDSTGHARGVDSDSWRLQIGILDRLVQDIANRLPADSLLVVTGDHGMVDLRPEERIDIDDHPELAAGVRLLGGEARARHVYTRPGATAEVLSAWREALGDRMWIMPREQAIDEGWFGPVVPDAFRPRIGDVVAAAHGPVGVVQRSVFALETKMVGHHGSLTAAEQLVPFLLVRR